MPGGRPVGSIKLRKPNFVSFRLAEKESIALRVVALKRSRETGKRVALSVVLREAIQLFLKSQP